jgi:hypothetical protein
MKEVLSKVNDASFIEKLNASEKVEILEHLIRNSYLFAKGSSQYHVKLIVDK